MCGKKDIMHWGNCANYSGRRRRIEVLAPFLVFFFNFPCHIKYASFSSHAFRAWSRVIWTKAIWRPIWRPELDHKIGIFVKKSISQRLKKSKKFSFRNSPFTRQHNISLNGTNSKDIRSRVSEMFYQQPEHARLVSCQCDAPVLSIKVWRKPFSKEMEFWWYLKQSWTTQMSNSRSIASMEMQDLNTNLVCHSDSE